jgi:ribosomal protein L15
MLVVNRPTPEGRLKEPRAWNRNGARKFGSIGHVRGQFEFSGRGGAPDHRRLATVTGPSAHVPRSGLERSDFVPWPISEVRHASLRFAQ